MVRLYVMLRASDAVRMDQGRDLHGSVILVGQDDYNLPDSAECRRDKYHVTWLRMVVDTEASDVKSSREG